MKHKAVVAAALLGLLAGAGCGPLAPDRHIFYTSVVVDEAVLQLTESRPTALVVVFATDEHESVQELVCFQERRFARHSRGELLPLDEDRLENLGSGSGEGCEAPYAVRAEVWTVGGGDCAGLNFEDVELLEDIERLERVASATAEASSDDSVCFNQAVEAYGTPLLGPLDVPPPIEIRLDETTLE